MGYLTDAELDAVQTLHKRAPYAVQGVSQSVFSIARHYGGMTMQGCRYVYIRETDECIRDDVLTMVAKMRKAAAKDKRKAPTQQALELP